MGYIKENKATIDSLSTTNINNKNTVSTVFLQSGIVNVTENLITNSLITESFKQPVDNTVVSAAVNLTRNDLLNKAFYIYENSGPVDINLPKMTSDDVGLVIRIGKISSAAITIIPASGDYLNSINTAGSTLLLNTNTFRDLILYKNIAGVSYWITQQSS